MQAEAARRIWTRSLEKYAFRYTTMLSDGDASTFAALTQLQPYGPDHVIVKLDCLNHAEKRMGTALCKRYRACTSDVTVKAMLSDFCPRH